MSVLNAYFASTLTWVLASPFLYGYHIAALNQIQLAIQCMVPEVPVTSTPTFPTLTLPTCLPMSNTTFGLVTSVFTVGGLLGSLSSNHFMSEYGRKGSARIAALLFFIGSVMGMVAWSSGILMLGRFVIGLGAGLAMCVGPVYLSEISPPKIKGSVGVLNQMSVVLGLCLAQVVGLFCSTAGTNKWRIVFLTSGGLCLAQILLSAGISDTPNWLAAAGRETESKAVAAKLWRDNTARPSGSEARALLAEEEARDEGAEDLEGSNMNIKPLTAMELFKVEPLRKPVAAILLAMFAQQISGINAVIFFSNAILARVVPGGEGYISLGVAVLNVIMTFPAIYLVEDLLRSVSVVGSCWCAFSYDLTIKKADVFAVFVQMLSMLGVQVTLIGLAVGLNKGDVRISSVAILAFVGSFAIGLGPVPFVLIGELVPFYASAAASSMALSLNWITNFFVASLFLPLRDWLSSPDDRMPSGRRGEGSVFFGFAFAFAITTLIFFRLYR